MEYILECGITILVFSGGETMKRSQVFLLVLTLAVFAGACSGKKADASAAKKDGVKHYAYCSGSTNDYWTVLQKGVKDAQAKYGIDMTFTTGPEGDTAALVGIVENAIAAGVDGIITAASDPDGFIEVLNRAADQGITVVTVDQDSPKSKRQYFVGTSNFQAGFDAGKKMIELTGGQARIVVFAGTITASNAVDRMAGFREAIKDEPGMEILTYEEVKNDVLITMQKTEAVLRAYPNLTAIYGVFAYDPLGAAKAIDEAGLGNKVTIVGFDDLEESIELLKKGVINALIVQQPYEIGFSAVETCVKAVNGEGPAPGEIGARVLIIDKDNVNDLYK
jgi:ribose transport system substrate-binding protein